MAFVSTSDTFRPGSPAVVYTVRSGNAQDTFSLPRGKGSGELSLPKPWIEITAKWRGQKITKTFNTVVRDDLRLAIIVSVRFDEDTGKIRFHRQQ